MRRYRSDAWDVGNYLTRYYEVHDECNQCGGRGEIEVEVLSCCNERLGMCECSDDDGDIVKKTVRCDMCNGDGEIVYYE